MIFYFDKKEEILLKENEFNILSEEEKKKCEKLETNFNVGDKLTLGSLDSYMVKLTDCEVFGIISVERILKSGYTAYMLTAKCGIEIDFKVIEEVSSNNELELLDSIIEVMNINEVINI